MTNSFLQKALFCKFLKFSLKNTEYRVLDERLKVRRSCKGASLFVLEGATLHL